MNGAANFPSQSAALKRLAAGVQVAPWPPCLYYLLTVVVQNETS